MHSSNRSQANFQILKLIYVCYYILCILYITYIYIYAIYVHIYTLIYIHKHIHIQFFSIITHVYTHILSKYTNSLYSIKDMLELLEEKQYFHRPTILPSPSFLFHHLPSIFFQFLPFSSHKKKLLTYHIC